MKNNLLSFLLSGILILAVQILYGQVGINNDGSDPHPSAMLHVKAVNKGVLLPQVTLVSYSSPDPLQNPAIGLVVQHVKNPLAGPSVVPDGIYYWDGTLWRQLSLPKDGNMSNILYWDGNQYLLLPKGNPGDVLTIASDSTLTWSRGGGSGSPSVVTSNPTEILQHSLRIGGNVLSDGGSAVTQRGIVFSQNLNPTLLNSKVPGGMGIGQFTVQITGLQPNTLYYLRAYAININDTVFGELVTAMTLPLMPPTVITLPVTGVTQNSAICGGNVLNDGGSFVSFRGVCWDTIPNPGLVGDRYTINGNGTGSFTTTIQNLITGKKYYVRAYAYNNLGTSFGQDTSFYTACQVTYPVGISIASASTTVCSNSSVTLTATPVNGGPSPVFQWRVNGVATGTNTPTFTFVPQHGDAVTCELFSNLPCAVENPATSNALSFTVIPSVTPSVSIVASNSSVCEGTMVSFLATATNGGTSPFFQWKVNGADTGASYPFFSYVPSPDDEVTCTLVSDAACRTADIAVSNTISMNVGAAVYVSVSVTASANNICQGTSVVYTAHPVNPGNNPVYEWFVNNVAAGTNTATFTWAPDHNDVITCKLTSGEPCAQNNPATSSPLLMTVNPQLPVSLTIAPSSNPSCSGSPVFFSASPVNPGSSPVYQWKVNNQNAGGNSAYFAYTPSNNDVVTCILTSNAVCATQNPATASEVVMSVTQSITADLTVTPSANPVCPGTMVSFTAIPVSGITSPLYQWRVNGVNVSGATNAIYNYTPSNNDVVSCVLSSGSQGCVTGLPATAQVTMTVNETNPLSVMVTPNINPICMNSVVTLSTQVVNGGTNPQYQWFINNNAVPGATGSSYYYIPENNDQVYCRVTSNAPCVSGSPGNSGIVTLQVIPGVLPEITISTSSGAVCAGTSVTFNSSVTNGGTTPQYQWKVNSASISGATGTSYTYVPVNGDVVSCVLTSNVSCALQNTVFSNTIPMTVNQPGVVSVIITASGNPVCAGSSVVFEANPVNGGVNPQYQWKVNGTPIEGATNAQYSFIPAHNDSVSCILTSDAACITGNPAASNLVVMTVNEPLVVGINIQASAASVCQGTEVDFTSAVVNEGSNPQYQWKVNGNNINGATNSSFSYIPSNQEIITCHLNSSEVCVIGNPAASNSISIQVIPSAQVSISIQASVNPVCPQSSVTFISDIVNGGSNPQYQWFVNSTAVGGATNAAFSYIPANGDRVGCTLTSDISCATDNPAGSNVVVMSVNPAVPVGVTITQSAGQVCAGTQVTYTATPENGGTMPTYQWFVNNNYQGTNNPVFTHTPVAGDQIYCILTSNVNCAVNNPDTSNTLVTTVLPLLPVSAEITASDNPVCSGTSVTFTASVINGGTYPVYQWMLNGNLAGSGLSEFVFVPGNGDLVKCIVTSDLTCVSDNPATSNQISMGVTDLQEVSVSIACDENPVCIGSGVTFTATIQNGGDEPLIDWFVNGISQVNNNLEFSYIPADQDSVWCVVTASGTCLTNNPAGSAKVIMVVNQQAEMTVSIAATANPVCSGTQTTLQATVTNGGAELQYQWSINGIPEGPDASEFSFIPSDGDAVVCMVISDSPCVTNPEVQSAPLIISVLPNVSPEIIIAPSATTVCSGTIVSYTAMVSNEGSNPVYQWKVNGYSVGTNSNEYQYVPVHGNVITCTLTSSLTCITQNPVVSNPVVMTVNPIVDASVTIVTPSLSICSGELTTFTAYPENGGNNPVITWKVNGNAVGENSNQFSYVPVDGDQVSCTLVSDHPCVNIQEVYSNIIELDVNPVVSASITITPDTTRVCQGSFVTFTAYTENGGPDPHYEWKVNGNSTGPDMPTFSFIPANGNVVTCILTSSEPCVQTQTVVSNDVMIAVLPQKPVSVSIMASQNPSCSGAGVTFIASGINGGNNPVYNWQVNGVSMGSNSATFLYTPSDNDSVTCTLTSEAVCATGNPAVSAPIIMDVLPQLIASVTVEADKDNICAGDMVTCTAYAVNGGSNPEYQWQVNDIVVGGNDAVYSYVPSDNDKVVCRVVSDAQCVQTAMVYSSPKFVNVISVAQVSLTISASANPACSGSSVTFTAIPENEGSNPSYQWMVNGIPQGGNSTVFSNIPVDGDVISCLLTSDASCITGNPALSNEIAMQVFTNLSVGTISGNQDVCGLYTPSELTSSPPLNGTDPVYQWQVSSDNMVFNDIPGATGSTHQPVSAPITLYYRQMQNASGTCGGPLPTGSVSVTVVPPVSVSVTITSDAVGIIYLGTIVTFTAAPVNGGASPQYHWFVNDALQTSTLPVFSYAPQNGDEVYCVLSSSLDCVTDNPDTSNIITMEVSSDPLLPAAVEIAASPAGAVCAGTMVTYTATPGNGGDTPQYQWKVNGIDHGANHPTFSYVPVNGDEVICLMTSSLPNAINNPATSNLLSTTVIPMVPVSVYIVASDNQVCAGTTVVFTATPVNGGDNPSYQWKVNGIPAGPDSPVFEYSPQQNDEVSCTLTSDLMCITGSPAISNTVIMQVDPVAELSVSVSPSANPVCAGDEVTFSATIQNGGSNPGYTWKVNGIVQGANSPSFTFVPANQNQVTCTVTSNLHCVTNSPATAEAVVMIVNPTAVAGISISTPSTSICQGTQVTLQATAVNGGANPVYQWKVNGSNTGSNSSQFTYFPGNLDEVTCELTSSLPCPQENPVTSDPIVFTVNPLVPVSVSVNATDNDICSGTSVDFQAVAVNGGTSPHYQWTVNGLNQGTNSSLFSYQPSDQDSITCILTSNATCATGNPAHSNAILMSVHPQLNLTVTISASANNICAGTQVTYTATVPSGISPVTYQWKVNGVVKGGNFPNLVHTPNPGDQIKCTVTSTAPCLYNSMNAAIYNPAVVPAVVVSISLSPSANPVCQGNDVTITAAAVNGGTSPVYQWMKNGTATGTNQSTYSFQPQSGDKVWCVLTSTVACAVNPVVNSDTITMAVDPFKVAGVTIASSANPACSNSPVTITATTVNGGTNPQFTWYLNGVQTETTTSQWSYNPSDGDNIYCRMLSSENCVQENPVTSNQLVLAVIAPVTVSATITPSANNVCAGTQVTFTATVINGGSSPQYQWMVNGSNAGTNGSTFTYIPLNNDVVKCEVTSGLNCTTANPVISNSVTMVISSSPAASVSITSSQTTVCNGGSVTVTATPVNGGTSPSYQWFKNNVAVGTNNYQYSFTPVNGDKVKCRMTSALQCVTGSPAMSNEITFTVNPVVQAGVTISASPSNTVCQGTSVVFTATAVNGGTAPAYQWRVNGVNVTGATTATHVYVPSNGDSISCIMTSNANCVSGSPATSAKIIMTVNPAMVVTASVWANKYSVVSGNPVTYYVKAVNGGTAPTYQWYVNTTPVLTGATTYTYNPANNDNIKCIVTSNLTGCVSGNPATSNQVNMIVYSTGTACSGIASVQHGGRTYHTAQIGTQCWLRENINHGTMVTGSTSQTNNGVVEKYCYQNDTNNCNIYGGLYQWAEMVQYLNNVTNTTHWPNPQPTNVQGVCPTGWHIPTTAEIDALKSYLGSTTAAGQLKETGTVHWRANNVGATNSTGFTSLPHGHVYAGAFANLKEYANFWTITKGQYNTDAYYRGTSYNFATMTEGQGYKTTGYGVRCIKNP